MDVTGKCLLYDEHMVRVFIADSFPEERSALRLLLLDLKMEIVGEANDWQTTLTLTPVSTLNMLVVDWELVPMDQSAALAELRLACPNPVVIVVISHLDTLMQATLSSGAEAFISKSDTPEQVIKRLQTAGESLL